MLCQFDNEDLIKINQGLRVGEVLPVLLRGERSPGVSSGLNRKEGAFICRHLNISETTKLPTFLEFYMFLVITAKGANNYIGKA